MFCFRRMLSVVVTIYVVTLVLFMPMFLLFVTRLAVAPSTNATTSGPNSHSHSAIPGDILAMTTGILMPTSVFIVIVSSVLVVVKLGAARRTRKQMSNSQNERSASQAEVKITQMLLSVCFLFIILALPETTGTLVNYFLPDFALTRCYHNTFSLFVRVVSVASCLNSSVNFIAYVSLSAKFRATLRQIQQCSAQRSTETKTSHPGSSATAVDTLTST